MIRRSALIAAGVALLCGCSREAERPALSVPPINAIAEHTTYKTVQNMPSVLIVSVRRGPRWRIESRTQDGSRAQVLVCDGRRVRAMNPEMLKHEPDTDYIDGRFALLNSIYADLDSFDFAGTQSLQGRKCWVFIAKTGTRMYFDKKTGWLVRIENNQMVADYFAVPPAICGDETLYSTEVLPELRLLPQVFEP